MHDPADSAIPRRLNDPAKFLWWDADVFVVAFAPVALGILGGSFPPGLLFGVLCGWAFGRAKAGRHKAYLMHLVYWHVGEPVIQLDRTPPSHLRELIG